MSWTAELPLNEKGQWEGEEVVCRKEAPANPLEEAEEKRISVPKRDRLKVTITQPGWVWSARKDFPFPSNVWMNQDPYFKKLWLGGLRTRDGFRNGYNVLVQVVVNNFIIAEAQAIYFNTKTDAELDSQEQPTSAAVVPVVEKTPEKPNPVAPVSSPTASTPQQKPQQTQPAQPSLPTPQQSLSQSQPPAQQQPQQQQLRHSIAVPPSAVPAQLSQVQNPEEEIRKLRALLEEKDREIANLRKLVGLELPVKNQETKPVVPTQQTASQQKPQTQQPTQSQNQPQQQPSSAPVPTQTQTQTQTQQSQQKTEEVQEQPKKRGWLW